MLKISITVRKWQLEAAVLALESCLYLPPNFPPLSWMEVGSDLFLMECDKEECARIAHCLDHISGADPVNGPDWRKLAKQFRKAQAGISNNFTA
jgi:hypothetical protein